MEPRIQYAQTKDGVSTEPGQILAADVVEQLAAGKGFTFADQGEASLKGSEKPARLHEVRWQE